MSEQQKKLKSVVTKYIWHLKIITCMGILTGVISPLPILSCLLECSLKECIKLSIKRTTKICNKRMHILASDPWKPAHFSHSSSQDKQESSSCVYLCPDPLAWLTGLVRGEMCRTLTSAAVKSAAGNSLTKEGMSKCVKELTADTVYRSWVCQETMCLCQIEIFLKWQLSPALKILHKQQNRRKGIFSQPKLPPAVFPQHCSWDSKYSRNKSFLRWLSVNCSFHQDF